MNITMKHRPDPKRWWALAVLLLGTFMVILDSFIVNVAIPTIQEQLSAGTAQIQFIVAAYVISYAVVLITGARLGDWLGRKKLFIIGMGLFIVASALCGFAATANFLIFSRVIQGIGAALLIPQVLAIIQVLFPPEEKGKAVGFYGAVSGLGLIAGQMIGGAMIHWNVWGLGWRSVFLINLPIGILAILLIIPLIKETRSAGKINMDLLGIFIMTGSLLLLIYPLVVGRESGWPFWVYFSFAGAIAAFFLFLAHEKKMVRRGGNPLIPTSMFHERTFSVGVLSILAYQIGNSGFFLVVSLTLQNGLFLTAIDSALAFVPIGAAFFLASMFGPKWAKANSSVLKWGAVLIVAGYVVAIAICAYFTAGLQWQYLIVPFFFIGFGQGLVGAPLMGTIMSGVRSDHAGSASGLLSTTMQTANALGIAGIGTIYFSSLVQQGDRHAGSLGLESYLYAFTRSLFCSSLLAIVTLMLLFGLIPQREKLRNLKQTN